MQHWSVCCERPWHHYDKSSTQQLEWASQSVIQRHQKCHHSIHCTPLLTHLSEKVCVSCTIFETRQVFCWKWPISPTQVYLGWYSWNFIKIFGVRRLESMDKTVKHTYLVDCICACSTKDVSFAFITVSIRCVLCSHLHIRKENHTCEFKWVYRSMFISFVRTMACDCDRHIVPEPEHTLC